MPLESVRDAPLTETMYYIMLSLATPRHGYGIILHVRKITNGRISLGAGTVYNSLSRILNEGLVEIREETCRRKIYALTARGCEKLLGEVERLHELYRNGLAFKEAMAPGRE